MSDYNHKTFKVVNHEEDSYLDSMNYILEKGELKADRTGTGTYSVFGGNLRFDLSKSFPLITTKKVHWKSIVHELLWFLKGDTNTKYLNDNGVKIWNEWADKNGELGPVYGKQWRQWEGEWIEPIDQIEQVIESIKTNPNSRRHIVSAWNVGELDDMALAPCHMMFQFNVREGKYLDCQLYQRSADMFLGVPFNIASYSLLTHMIAQVTGLEAGDFAHVLGDAHIYINHVEQVKTQLSREAFEFPQIKLNPKITNIDDFTYEDIELVDYKSHEAIKGKVAV